MTQMVSNSINVSNLHRRSILMAAFLFVLPAAQLNFFACGSESSPHQGGLGGFDSPRLFRRLIGKLRSLGSPRARTFSTKRRDICSGIARFLFACARCTLTFDF